MKILFLGDVVGISGCNKLIDNLPIQIKQKKIDFVIVNGENADDSGLGLIKKFVKNFLIVVLMSLLVEIMFGIKKIL